MTSVAEAYAFCRKIAHRYGANFSVGFRFLPRRKREAVYAAYAYCRWADDIADEGHGVIPSREDGEGSRATPGDPSASSRLRMTRLSAWQCELDACYDRRPAHPITIALADALRSFAIPKRAFVDLIDGCRQDMVKTRYATFDELLHYCHLVASSIADVSLAIFGYRHDAALDHGRSLATALQLTNVSRDVGDDLDRGRVYLPEEELHTFGVSEHDLFARRPTEGIRRLMEFQIARAESYFRAAEPLLDELSCDARFPVLLMGGIYATVLRKLRRDPLVVLQRRLSLTRGQKIRVVAARLLRPHFV